MDEYINEWNTQKIYICISLKNLLSVSRSVISDSLRPYGLSMEFSRQDYWSGLPFLSPWDLWKPGIKPRSPSFQADSLPSELPGKPEKYYSYPIFKRMCVCVCVCISLKMFLINLFLIGV